jgi:hypothetical protein
LLVETSQIRDKILDDRHVGKRVDSDGLAIIGNTAKASKGVAAVNVHSTRTANTFTARTTEGNRGVLVRLNADKSIKNHGANLGGINFESLQMRLSLSLRIEAVQLERTSAHLTSTGNANSLSGNTSDSSVHLYNNKMGDKTNRESKICGDSIKTRP